MSDKEEWRAVVGHEGFYEVSSLGRVRSCLRGMLRPDASDARYHHVRLTKNGVKVKRGVHVLMLEAFVGPGGGLWACHRNDIGTDNVLSNLYWGTPQNNADDRVKNGHGCAADAHPQRKLSSELVSWVRESHQSSIALGIALGVASSTIRAIRIGQNWTSHA